MVLTIKRERVINKMLIYFSITIITIILVFPFIWMLSTSLKDKTEIFSIVPKLIPNNITFENYKRMWFDFKFYIYLKNSIIVSIFTTIISLIISTFLSYGLSRFKFRGKTVIFNLLILTQMFPLPLLIITIYIKFVDFKLVDSLLGLIITYFTFAVPFSTLILKSYFDALPYELEEAAAIDGCSPISTIFKIIIPLSAPGIVAVGLFSFILSWQEFMMALTLIRTTEMRTLPVAINMMIGVREIFWGPLMAGTTVVTLPVVIVFIYVQKHIISGLTMGAVKG